MLAIAIILALLVVVIPASPALAAESIRVSPTKGEIGDKIRVTGSGYTPGERVYIYFSSQEAEERDQMDDDVTAYERVETDYPDEDGYISEYFLVPEKLTDGDDEEDVRGGEYYIYVTYSDSDRIEAVDEFTVRDIELDPSEGPVGTEVEISGVGFDTNEDIEYIKYDDEEIDIASGDEETDSDGAFTCTIIIPEDIAGAHTILVRDDSRNEAEAEFTVEPEIVVDPTSGLIGDIVSVSGTGFAKSQDVTIYFNDVIMTLISGTAETDYYGSFANLRFTVPAVEPATYEIEAEDEDGNTAKAEAEFILPTTAEMSPTTGNIGTEVTVSGSGFVADGIATIKYGDNEVAKAPIDSDGAFSATFSAPVSEGGEHIVTVSDDTNSKSFTFTMESEAPSIPAPLLPEQGIKIEGEAAAYFDWEDVEDPSGVTYTLQIASDADFTTIVLEKKGLTRSKYTLTEAEKLPPVKKEAPYYWRVKAIDDASNEGEWSGTGSFYVGSVFTMPSWIIYALFGVGALLFGILGFWMGRRTAYF